MTPEGLQRGLAYARQAIEADPGYAKAYAYISGAYSAIGLLGFLTSAEVFPKARAAAQKALELDDSVAEAHPVLGLVRLCYEWDWSGAEHELSRALELNPNYAFGCAIWSDWLLVTGRHERALGEEQLAAELDPLSAVHIFSPQTLAEFNSVMFSEHSGHLRMVVTYWDMAAALVNDGAIRSELFSDCNGEHIGVFSKVELLLPEIRTAYGPQFASSLEKLIDATPDGRKRSAMARERMKGIRETLAKQQAQTA